ncbi:hypothetical protein [Halomonas caseinilytica]|uniref:Cytochrome oxidase Cu insertion factor, SCO1/SenC/PrrC family n=1 Tax=Halomonas caseinilytica TaxID=438744 RepID=A0A1M6P0G4_9GAMM|nr:hypothetical protein [Halomonas caseinilytica]SHK01406.1 hypothetical protein SAMN05192556_101580 [Halomonas caseinilytica]
MTDARIVRSRLKLLALFAVFALPMAMAWGMVEWRLGIPDERTAHGELHPDLPRLADWPLSRVAKDGADDWLMAFDCTNDCAASADRWWRVHRALGRDAHRVSRLRIGEGGGKTLPGEAIATWHEMPTWREPGTLWILDPDGRPVLSYGEGVAASNVLEDIERLLKLNPERPLARLHDE